MARRTRTRRSSQKRRSRSAEQAKCRFCREKVSEIDYKDIATLSKLTTQQGKMFSRKRSGNCARHQRSVKRAVKRARYMALLPYVA
ncbi:MAG: 30S ribosomal protein S18 [Phycisphaerae bacterium]